MGLEATRERWCLRRQSPGMGSSRGTGRQRRKCAAALWPGVCLLTGEGEEGVENRDSAQGLESPGFGEHLVM